MSHAGLGKKVPRRTIIFDHDSTLVDVTELVIAATNGVLQSYGHSSVDAETISAGLVQPTGQRIGELLGIEGFEEQARLTEKYFEQAAVLSKAHARLYSGIADTLAALQTRGWRLAILSNNPGYLVRRIASDLDILHYFSVVLGEEDIAEPKPDPSGVYQVLGGTHTEARSAVFIGDGDSDAGAARSAGIYSIGVAWCGTPGRILKELGFDSFVDRPDELPDMVESVVCIG